MSAPSSRPGILEAPWHYDLYNVLRRLERQVPSYPRIGNAVRRSDDIVTLGQDPFLEFPVATINRARYDGEARLSLSVRFLGLLGPQGALPLSVTEEAYGWHLARDDAFATFLDILNHRFLELYYRAWADARPIAQHDRREEDRFERYVGAVVGLGSDKAEPVDSVPRLAKLAFAGLLSARIISASRLEDFLGGLFDVAVEVEEFVPMTLHLEPDDQSALGGTNSALGVDLMLGASVATFQEKIRVRVLTTTLQEYEGFLPDGPNAPRLADAITFVLGQELEWDVELALPVEAAPEARLGSAGRLGWSGWMNPRHPGQTQRTLCDARLRPTRGGPAQANRVH